MMLGHHYDGIGICIYCNECDDPTCCGAAEPCTKSVIKQLQATREVIQDEIARRREET